jgi:ApeA N-terminal domain 1
VKPHSEQGFWWLPEEADNRIVGTVSYGPCEGFDIDLVGSLTGTALDFGTPNTLKETFEVWGLTVRRKPVTLFQAHQAITTIHLPGWPTSRIEAAQGVIGGHYRNWEEALVHTVDVEFEHLPSWSQMSGITETHDVSKKSNTIVLAPPDGVQIAEKEGIRIKVVP